MISAVSTGITNKSEISLYETIMFIGLMIGNTGGEFGVIGPRV